MAQFDRWEKSKLIPNGVVTSIDDNILAKLPDGTTVVSMTEKSLSLWTKMAEIETTDSNGENTKYFLKVSEGDIGKEMMRGEFQSMCALREASPNIVPEPLAWGTCNAYPNIHFFLCVFLEMQNEVPGDKLGVQIAELHANGTSPAKKFGFPLTTYQGNLPQDNTECDTWEESFSRGMKNFFELEEKTQGYEIEMVELRQGIMEKVIPRLLRPLETGGRKVVPTLVHGDLWDGNAALLDSTGQPIIFDACCSYAHNEYELAPWKAERHAIGEEHIKAYLATYYGDILPDVDFEDRLELYCLFNLCSAALHNGSHWRELVKSQMRALVEKFPRGHEELATSENISTGQGDADGETLRIDPVTKIHGRQGKSTTDLAWRVTDSKDQNAPGLDTVDSSEGNDVHKETTGAAHADYHVSPQHEAAPEKLDTDSATRDCKDDKQNTAEDANNLPTSEADQHLAALSESQLQKLN